LEQGGETPQRHPGLYLSTGYKVLDRLLPYGGYQPGTLVEWLSPALGSAAGTLALVSARQAAAAGGALVVIDEGGDFYPPAAAGLGVDLGRTIVVRVSQRRDAIWAIDQALRCRGVAAVLAWTAVSDSRTWRRWQLAAEEGGSLGLLLRACDVRGAPAWAEVRWWVEGLAPRNEEERIGADRRRVRVELARCRSIGRRGMVEVELGAGEFPSAEILRPEFRYSTHHATPALHMAAELAAAAPLRRAAGA